MHLHGSSSCVWSLSCHVCFVCASCHAHVIHVCLTADWHLDCARDWPILVIFFWHGSGADVDLVSGIWCWVKSWTWQLSSGRRLRPSGRERQRWCRHCSMKSDYWEQSGATQPPTTPAGRGIIDTRIGSRLCFQVTRARGATGVSSCVPACHWLTSNLDGWCKQQSWQHTQVFGYRVNLWTKTWTHSSGTCSSCWQADPHCRSSDNSQAENWHSAILLEGAIRVRKPVPWHSCKG